MDVQPTSSTSGLWSVSVAIGITVLLVGLIVNPLVIAPLGGAIILLGGFFWMRANSGGPQREIAVEPPAAGRSDVDAERFPRSRLLERATLAFGGIVALGAALPAAGVAVLSSFGGRRPRAIDLGATGAFPEGQFVVATFLSDPEAGEVSRRAAYVRNNGLLGNVPSFTILSSRCTHVGCPTQPNGPILAQRHKVERTSTGEVGLVPARASGFGCPCHGSEFDNEGNRTAGPAPRALDRYQFSIRNGRLWLGRLYSVGRVQGTGAQARIESFPLKDPGQSVTGPEAWLYPLNTRS
jgi:Rieske Fe-S protein